MSGTTTSSIVQRLWGLCNILRDDGITYQDYVTELTYLLFLKMLAETGKQDVVPEELPLGRADSAGGRCAADALPRHAAEAWHRRQPRASAASSPTPRPRCASRPICVSWSGRSRSWTGIRRRRKGSATSTKACWRRTPPRRNPARASISPRAR
ncbi:type I restriction-modification system subunit M N-terminal domain-containing protein [Dankookia sp. P2]|uniref:type I restriction-modification system subunit M N-terminal domain-containing protein n=1 Tax=Dankookia sp. P2 TaxID=3423955 RepID=UPI003D677027